MAEPAKKPVVEAPPIDPTAIEREYHRQRAKRLHRERRTREQRAANIRFWIVMVVLLVPSVYLAILFWHQVQKLFGI
jgi:hypothetical protein